VRLVAVIGMVGRAGAVLEVVRVTVTAAAAVVVKVAVVSMESLCAKGLVLKNPGVLRLVAVIGMMGRAGAVLEVVRVTVTAAAAVVVKVVVVTTERRSANCEVLKNPSVLRLVAVNGVVGIVGRASAVLEVVRVTVMVKVAVVTAESLCAKGEVLKNPYVLRLVAVIGMMGRAGAVLEVVRVTVMAAAAVVVKVAVVTTE